MFPILWLVMVPEPPLLKVKPEIEYWGDVGDTGVDFFFCFEVEMGFFFFFDCSKGTGSTSGVSVSYSSSSYAGLSLLLLLVLLVFDWVALLVEPCLEVPSSTPLLKFKSEIEYWGDSEVGFLFCFGTEKHSLSNCSSGSRGSSIGISLSYSSSSSTGFTPFLVFDWAALFVREPCLEVPSTTSSSESSSWYLVFFFFSSISDFL